MIRKGARKCPHSDPMKPHYFRPLYRNQEACCVIRTPVAWPPRELCIPSDKRRKLLKVLELSAQAENQERDES